MHKKFFLCLMLQFTLAPLSGCNLFLGGDLEEANCQDDSQCPGGACVRGVCVAAAPDDMGDDDSQTPDIPQDIPQEDASDATSDPQDPDLTQDADPADTPDTQDDLDAVTDVIDDLPQDTTPDAPADLIEDATEDATADLIDASDNRDDLPEDLDPIEDLPPDLLQDAPDILEDTPDALECVCESGEVCVDGSCQCNIEQNQDNRNNCGCQGPCDLHSVCAVGACKPIFLELPYGSFTMGAPTLESSPRFAHDEAPHPVTLTRSFAAQVTEVTQRQWRSLMGTLPDGNTPGCDDCPVVHVSRADATAYADQLSRLEERIPCSDPTQNSRPPYECTAYRLPTEAEWEYLARANTQTAFWSGPLQEPLTCNSEPSLVITGRYCYRAEGAADRVAQFLPNPWRLFDVHGNVAEWTLDSYRTDLTALAPIDPFVHQSLQGIVRGGAWDDLPIDCRAASRRAEPADYRGDDVGFRLVRSLTACMPANHARDDNNCACLGPCEAGHACEDGACACLPRQHDRDDDNCGCNGPCAPHEFCELGQCVPELAFLPPVYFRMGTPGAQGDTADEAPVDVLLTRGFFLHRAEITQGFWSQIVDTQPPFAHTDCGPDCPAENLTWYDALDFANRLSTHDGLPTCFFLDECSSNTPGLRTFCSFTQLESAGMTLPSPYHCQGYRLPTEAEWEYAARAGTTSTYICGEDEGCIGAHAWTSDNAAMTPHAVASKSPNAFGLFDMFGNVEEWTLDHYNSSYIAIDPDGIDPYFYDIFNNPRSVRGGSFRRAVQRLPRRRAASRANVLHQQP
jgi:formylglycine-generating enzyme required for sulfatase activity